MNQIGVHLCKKSKRGRRQPPPMMFEEVKIQMGVQSNNPKSCGGGGGGGVEGGAAPHDVRRSDDSHREGLVMLRMREAKAKTNEPEELGKQRMRKAKTTKSCINQRKAANVTWFELGMQRMRKS